MTDYRKTTGTSTQTDSGGVIEQADATVQNFDFLVPPNGKGAVTVEIENKLMYVGDNDPNRCAPDHQDVINPKGAILGASGSAVAGAAYGGTIGSVVPLGGTALGATIVGGGAALGSLAGSAYEAISGALSITTNIIIDGKVRGAAVSCVPVSGPIGTTKKSVSFNFETPTEPGTYDVDIIVSATNTGELVRHFNTSITVEDDVVEDPAVGRNEEDDNGNGSDWQRWAMNNPVKAGILGIGSLVAIRTATESAITGE